jgi:hypothetical protein
MDNNKKGDIMYILAGVVILVVYAVVNDMAYTDCFMQGIC